MKTCLEVHHSHQENNKFHIFLEQLKFTCPFQFPPQIRIRNHSIQKAKFQTQTEQDTFLKSTLE